jgi:transglutaminase-like putative cysteine protease
MIQSRELRDVADTGREMYRMAKAWKQDMAPYATMSASQVFNLLRSIPYRPDPPDVEFLQRPRYTLSMSGAGGDCDDKAIASGAWAHLNGIPFRFVAVSRYSDRPLHHVFTEMYIGNSWIAFDPTYSFNVLGRPMCEYPQRVLLRP